jgi:hypothetical protein
MQLLFKYKMNILFKKNVSLIKQKQKKHETMKHEFYVFLFLYIVYFL